MFGRVMVKTSKSILVAHEVTLVVDFLSEKCSPCALVPVSGCMKSMQFCFIEEIVQWCPMGNKFLSMNK